MPRAKEQPTANDRTIQMSEADLQTLLRDVAQGGGILPPGAYRESGEVWRDWLEPTGRRRRNKATGQMEDVNRKVKRRVYLTYDTSPSGLVAAKKAAYRAGLDFYHPVYGWLHDGWKREVEVPENMGTGGQLYEMEYTPVAEEEDLGTSSVTVQGVPTNDPEERPAPKQSAFSDEALAQADEMLAASRGREVQPPSRIESQG